MKDVRHVTTHVSRQTGFALLDVIVAIGIALLIGAGSVLTIQSSFKRLKTSDTAAILQADINYSEKYLNDYISVIQNNLTAGGQSYVIPLGFPSDFNPTPSLTGGLPTPGQANLLPANFTDLDPFGQKHLIVVQKLADGTVQALLISTGGQNISDGLLGDITLKVGSIAGFIPSTSSIFGNSYIRGALGGWTYPLSTISPSNYALSFTSGHYAAILYLSPPLSTKSVGPYLDRFSTGDPSVNTMNTNIIANGNALSNLNKISFSTGAVISQSPSQPVTIASTNLVGPTLSVQGNQIVSTNNVFGNQTIGGNESVNGILHVDGNSTAAQINFSPVAISGASCTSAGYSPGTVAGSNAGNGQLFACEGQPGSAVWQSLNPTSTTTNTSFSVYFNIGCSNPISWTNTGSGAAAVTLSNSAMGDGGFGFSITDTAGNVVSVPIFSGYAQSFSWFQSQTAIVPAGATISASTGGTGATAVCLSGYHS